MSKLLTQLLSTSHPPGADKGVAHALRTHGFRPAYLDFATMRILSPREWGALENKETLVAGYERGGFFYTPRSTGRACREWGCA